MNNAATTLRTMFISLLLVIGCGLVTQSQAQETPQDEYPDVPRGHWAYNALSHVSNGGCINGFPDGQFHGDKAMKRYEFARVISIFGTYHGFTPKLFSYNAMRSRRPTESVAMRSHSISVIPVQHQQSPDYPDVSLSHWAYNGASVASMMGVIEGLPNGTFGGNSVLTRYECTVALARLLNSWQRRTTNQHSEKNKAPVVTSYPDVPDTHWAFQAIRTLNKNGIFEGFADGNFHGSEPMSRYEFAVTLARVLRLGSR